MSISSFSTRTRNAGTLDSENKIYGSFRSINKFDTVSLPRSKHDDIFNDQIEIEPIKDIPPQPPRNAENEEKREKKSSRRRKESREDNAQNDESTRKSNRNREERRKRRERRESRDRDRDRDSRNRDSSSTRKPNETDTPKIEDEEIIESLKRMTSKHRQRRAESIRSKEEKENQNNQPNLESSSFSSQSKGKLTKAPSENNLVNNVNNNREVENKDKLKHRKTNSFVKTNAFEEPAKPESDSDGEHDTKVDIDKKANNTSDIQKTNSNSSMAHLEYFKPIRNGDTLNFILTPPPQNQIINCKILCKKGIFNEYYFYVENISNIDLLIMKAHRKVTSTKPYYSIDTINYDQYGHANTTEVNCARIVSNMSRKKFKLDLSSNFVQFNNNEILSISIKSSMGEPRKMLASSSLCTGAKNNSPDKVTYFLKNRQPVFDSQRKKFVLNYNGRAKQSSKNNFQIVDESPSSQDDILMQLGKVETSFYNCDFAFPLCALQAFGFALSSLCR